MDSYYWPYYYSFLEYSGSDERRYCSPGVDIPMCSIMRSKYGSYKEYHTSKDNLSFISPKGFQGSLNIYKKVIKPNENELKNHKDYLKKNLNKNYFN